MKNFDVIIIGGGPVGLYTAFYAGMRGLSVAILEAFDEVGGQPQNLYPEKKIYDIAGLPGISGSDLIKDQLAQLDKIPYELFCGQHVEKIIKNADNFTVVSKERDGQKREFTSQAVILTTGAGLISPRKLGLDKEDDWYEAGKLSYFIRSLQDFAGQKVAVLGGGDSALDWALMLEKVADQVHLVHRRTAFRAHAHTVDQLADSQVQVHTPYTVEQLLDDGLQLKVAKGQDLLDLRVDKILVNYGFLTNQMDLIEGLATNRNGRISVDRQMRTNIAGIYAAGDGADYEGKVPLMAVGFGEAVTAVNAITQDLTFSQKLRKGHSSSLFEEK